MELSALHAHTCIHAHEYQKEGQVSPVQLLFTSVWEKIALYLQGSTGLCKCIIKSEVFIADISHKNALDI